MSADLHQLGKYRVLEELGAGGFATVFKAVDTTLDREVALKILHPPLLTDRRFVQNFRQEARTLAALRHPQIITIYEVGETDGRIFIAMELARGASLARAIAERGRIPWAEMLALLKPVCDALDYAHQQGVVHRDLKPANILIDRQRGALLTDFGFAKLLAENPASMTMSGGIVGTPGYIAPEVWENNAADAPVDIYALGCVAYEMLTGDVLFKGQTPMQAVYSHSRGPQFPATWPDDVPPKIADVLAKALAREPASRYPSAGALWRALNDFDHHSQVEQTTPAQAGTTRHTATTYTENSGHAAKEAILHPREESLSRSETQQTAVPRLQAVNVPLISVALCLLAIVMNTAGRQFVIALQLPISLDTVGTVLAGVLLGPWFGAIVGLLGHASWTLFGLDQYAVWFAPVAGVSGLLAGSAGRLGLFRYTAPRWLSALVGGVFVFALVLFVFMFVNSTSSGGERPTLPVAGDLVAENGPVFLLALAVGLAAGYFVLKNVGYVGAVGLLTGVATSIVVGSIWARLFGGEPATITGSLLFGRESIVEPFDKMLSFMMVYLIIQLLPCRVLERFPNTRSVDGDQR